MSATVNLLDLLDIDGEMRIVVEISQHNGKPNIKTQSLREYIEQNTVMTINGEHYPIADVVNKEIRRFLRTNG